MLSHDQNVGAGERVGVIGAGVGQVIFAGQGIDVGAVALGDRPQGFLGCGIIDGTLCDGSVGLLAKAYRGDGGDLPMFPKAQGDTKLGIDADAPLALVAAGFGVDDVDGRIVAKHCGDGVVLTNIDAATEGTLDLTGEKLRFAAEEQMIMAAAGKDAAVALCGDVDAIGLHACPDIDQGCRRWRAQLLGRDQLAFRYVGIDAAERERNAAMLLIDDAFLTDTAKIMGIGQRYLMLRVGLQGKSGIAQQLAVIQGQIELGAAALHGSLAAWQQSVHGNFSGKGDLTGKDCGRRRCGTIVFGRRRGVALQEQLEVKLTAAVDTVTGGSDLLGQ